jgi:porin
VKDSLFRIPVLSDAFQSRSDWKAGLAKKYGLKFGISYTMLYLNASDSSLGTEDSAFGFDFDVAGTWEFHGRGTDSPSMLGFDFFWRDRLTTDLTPLLLFTQYGSLNSGAPAYGENPPLVGELWYQQKIRNTFGFRIGQVFPVTAYDFFPFKNFRTDFIDFNNVTNASIPLPLQGLGGFLVYKPMPRLQFKLGLHDANADPTKIGFDTYNGELFKILEIGFDTGSGTQGPGRPPDGHVHLSAWHQDERKDVGIDTGWGISATGAQRFGRFTPFLRYGYSNGGADGPTTVQHMASLGVGIDQIFGQSADRIGVAFSWFKPADSALDNESTIDAYYRVQLTPAIEIGPTLQVVFDPVLNPDKNRVIVGGLRTRIAL